MSADKRSVQTDALSVLGTIIDDTVGRDAIHLAVEPVVAKSRLHPGERIGLDADGHAVAADVHTCVTGYLGIVDPFIPHTPINAGQRFLMILKPGQIATLRHVWDHPAFPPAQIGGVELGVPAAAQPSDAKTWLENFARDRHVSYQDLLTGILDWSKYDDQPWWWSAADDAIYSEFWDKVDAVMPMKLSRGEIDFSCRGC